MDQFLLKYLKSSEAIDFDNALVFNKAEELSSGLNADIDIAEKCYEFVRDEIYHCADYDMNPVTYKASEVLIHKTGFCFAKSHLLAALLRANSIPAGLCYQRIKSEKFNRFFLHGLAALFLQDYGWYRVDVRGNKEGIDAQFNPPDEILAYKNLLPGECLFPEIWIEPVYSVKELLTKHIDYKEACNHLPDAPNPPEAGIKVVKSELLKNSKIFTMGV